MRAPRPWSRGFVAGLVGVLVASVVTGCGQPDYTYVRSSEYQTVFRVPKDWNEISPDDLQASLFGADSASAEAAAETSWVAGFDASDDPDVEHLFGLEAEEPNLYAVVRELDPSTQSSLSLDGMRDLLLPVSPGARQRAAAPGKATAGFELLTDELIEQDDGMRGVHVVFNYDLGGSLQTFDQTVLVDQATSRMHVLLVRCSAACYRDRNDELQAVVTSYTVKA
jgi:hypothetical protein